MNYFIIAINFPLIYKEYCFNRTIDYTVSVIFARSVFEMPCFNTVVGIDYVICPGRSPHLSWLYNTERVRSNEQINGRKIARWLNRRIKAARCVCRYQQLTAIISRRAACAAATLYSESSLCAQFTLSKLTLIHFRVRLSFIRALNFLENAIGELFTTFNVRVLLWL